MRSIASSVLFDPVPAITGTRFAVSSTHISTANLCSSWLKVGDSPVVPTGTSPCIPSDIWKSIRDLNDFAKQQILVGGVSGAATYVYEKFLAEEPPQEDTETFEQYKERRRISVGNKMRTYFDNYFG